MKPRLAHAAVTALLVSAAIGAEAPRSDEDAVAQMVTEFDRYARQKDLETFLWRGDGQNVAQDYSLEII
jgi:hypothetical protein